MKDNFSHGSKNYAQFRPGYPKEVFAFLRTILTGKKRVWDCATGTGQVAKELVAIFDEIEATDLSENQLKNAVSDPKIRYSQQAAEQTKFPPAYFDCVTVGQAIHWFDFEEFYDEVKRITKPGALLVILGYGNIVIENPEIGKLVKELYSGILGNYWDTERHYIDENYQTIPFPFEEIQSPKFEQHYAWSMEQLTGYLETWSAVKHYKDKTGKDPILEFKNKLPDVDEVTVCFPILCRIGKIV